MIRPKGQVFSCPGCQHPVATLVCDVKSGDILKREQFLFEPGYRLENGERPSLTHCCTQPWLR